MKIHHIIQGDFLASWKDWEFFFLCTDPHFYGLHYQDGWMIRPKLKCLLYQKDFNKIDFYMVTISLGTCQLCFIWNVFRKDDLDQRNTHLQMSYGNFCFHHLEGGKNQLNEWVFPCLPILRDHCTYTLMASRWFWLSQYHF